MREGRDRSEWDRWSQLLTLTANCHRGKGRPFRVRDFHPYLRGSDDVREGRVEDVAQWFVPDAGNKSHAN